MVPGRTLGSHDHMEGIVGTHNSNWGALSTLECMRRSMGHIAAPDESGEIYPSL